MAAKTKRASTPRRDVRPFVYAGFDFVFATLYAVALTTVAVNRIWWAQALLWGLVACIAVMGGAMCYRRSWSWLAGVVAAVLLLVLTVVILILILMSAAFLSGVYGAFGRAAASFSMLAAALLIEMVALLPALQLKFLMTRAGRRAFGLPPVWK